MGSAGPSSALFRNEPNLVNTDTHYPSDKLAIEGALPQHQGMQKVPFVAHSIASNIGDSNLSDISDKETHDTSSANYQKTNVTKYNYNKIQMEQNANRRIEEL